MKEEMIEFLEERKDDLERKMNAISKDFAYDYGDITSSSYICDCFSEYADGRVDIYYGELFDWTKENWNYVEEAIDEFGVAQDSDKRADLIRTIQSGQYLYYDRQLYEDEDEIIELLAVRYLLEERPEIEEKQVEEILDRVNTEIDNGNRFSDILDIIEEVVKGEDEDV